MQVKKEKTLNANSELPILNLNPLTSSLKPIKQPLLLFSPALQRKNKNNISYHQPPNKVPSESVPQQQTIKSLRGRSITLNKLDLSRHIQPIPLQSLQKQLFIHQLKFVEPIEKTKQDKQQSRFYIKKQIYNEKNNTEFQNNQKLNLVQNIPNNYKPQVGLKQIKQNIYLNQQSYKKQSYQQFTKIIPKYHQEYTKQLIKQLPKFLDIDNYKCYDNQQKFLTEYEFALNMSEIQEMNEDGLSSNAQSTFYNKVC